MFSPNSVLDERLEKCIRVKQFDCARLVQTFSKFRGDPEFNRAEIILQLRTVRSSHNGRSDSGLCSNPVQSHLRRLFIQLLRYLKKSIQHSPIVLGKSVGELGVLRRVKPAFTPSGVSFSPIFSAEKAASEWAPWTQSDAQLLCHRNMLAFNVAFDERIFQL